MNATLAEIGDVIASGGYIMIALGMLSLLLYRNIVGLLLFVRNVRLEDLEMRDREGFADRKSIAQTDLSQVEWEVLLSKYEDVLWRFRQFANSRIKFTQALLVAAPLLGLLGTVIGMLDTFRGLSLQAGYETARLVADGVSRALITTQTGLTIAIPALFFIYWIRRISRRRELELLESKVLVFGKLEERDTASA